MLAWRQVWFFLIFLNNGASHNKGRTGCIQKIIQGVSLRATISSGLDNVEDIQLVPDQTDSIASIIVHWRELVNHIFDMIHVMPDWELEVSFDIKYSLTSGAWGMGYLKFFHRGKIDGRNLEREFSFKVFPNGLFKDQTFDSFIELSASDLLIKVVQLAEECGLGRKKAPKEVRADRSLLSRKRCARIKIIKALR